MTLVTQRRRAGSFRDKPVISDRVSPRSLKYPNAHAALLCDEQGAYPAELNDGA